MTDLITALEAAEGPSRELDARIAILVDFEVIGLFPHTIKDVIEHFRGDLLHVLNNPHSALSSIPNYTASIDAALTLVPDGWDYDMWGRDVKSGICIWKSGIVIGIYDSITVDHSNPAIAICIAALKAHQQQEPING